jgi:tetratricopeptide (TPR) repeat protein
MVRLARAFDQANAPDSATVYFERYLGHYGPFRFTPENDGVFLGGIYKRLGELYEAKGDRAKAAAYYRKFVALWKTADPELQPKVSEVQRRLARVGVPDG